MTRSVLPRKVWEQNMTGQLDGPYCELVELSEDQRQRYLGAVAAGASMHAAASALGIPFLAVGRLIAADETFAKDLDVAKQLRLMALEEILIDQASVGIDEPLTYQGSITHEYTEWGEPDEFGLRAGVEESRRPVTIKKLVTSNPTLLAILKANDREKWKDRSEVQHTPIAAELPARIHSESDREKLIAALERRVAEREDDNVEDLL